MLKRNEIKEEDTWLLNDMYPSPTSWEEEFKTIEEKIPTLVQFKGHLKDNKETLLNALKTIESLLSKVEKLATYAFLEFSVDSINPSVQMRKGKIDNLLANLSAYMSFFDPEIMGLDEKELNSYLKCEEFKPYKVYIQKLLRMKPHTLSESEEKILALYSLVSSNSYDTFNILNNADLHFDSVDGNELTHSTYQAFMLNEDEKIRKEAYLNLYKAYKEHANTLATIYSGSVNNDIFTSKSRNYPSSLEASLFQDNVDKSVYLALIEAVHEAFPILHRYYKLRAKLLGKEKLAHYDMYVPLFKSEKVKIPYNDAVKLIKEAIKPLGEEYQNILVNGLTTSRWVDKYENEGKRSGAFSSGCYESMPYILTNYNDEVLSSVFTLIHEGGHSMHSYYSKLNNPYLSHEYTIFEAEVASTFNEQLLQHYLINNAVSKEEKKYLIAKQLDDIVATLFRQTMFAEFELIIHEKAENGEPVTLSSMREVYKNLLISYFGPNVEFLEESDLECLRIPHFYTAFYTYKYATGISAAIALSEKVLKGGDKERNDYISFLKSGGSSYPIESLKKAGVDMSTKKPVEDATKHFEKLMDELESLLD